MVIVQKQQKAGVNAQTITIVTQINYDILGRPEKIEKRQSHSQLNGGAMSAFATLSAMKYDALGQLKTKILAPDFTVPADASVTELQRLTYDLTGQKQLLIKIMLTVLF